MRPGELATRLGVEASHVTRQVQRLQQAGYADGVPDPSDRRAQLIQLTPAGRAAVGRIREAGETGMQAALAHWPPQELHQLSTLLHRMVDDFLAYTADSLNGLILTVSPLQSGSPRSAGTASTSPAPAGGAGGCMERARIWATSTTSRVSLASPLAFLAATASPSMTRQ